MKDEQMLVSAYSFFDEEDSNFKTEMEVEDLLVDIACEFINYRAANKMTQKDLAEKLDITQAMVSKLESGDYNPTVKMLFEIAQKLEWNFKLEFSSKREKKDYYFDGEGADQSEEYFDNMGLAS